MARTGKQVSQWGPVLLTAGLVVLLGGCAALHAPIDERPTVRDGIAGNGAGTDGPEAADEMTIANGADEEVFMFADGSPQPIVDPRRPGSRETPSTIRDRDSADPGGAEKPAFQVYRNGDRRLSCAELDQAIAQLQGQSAAPITGAEPGDAAAIERSTGLVSRIMDSAVVSGIRQTITGEPSAADLEERAIRQRVEWLRDLKTEKRCFATQPLF